jgi:Tol biopolymer transport system component
MSINRLIVAGLAGWIVTAGPTAAQARDGHCGCGSNASIPANRSPAWSPDGRRIAFTRYDDDAGPDLYVMNADGSRRRPLLQGEGNEYDPDWSPDGRRIAFARTEGDESDVYVINADGTGLARLTSTEAYDGDPDWSPD